MIGSHRRVSLPGRYAGEAYAYVERTGNRLLAPLTLEHDSFSHLLAFFQQQLDKASLSANRWLENQWASSGARSTQRLSQKIKDLFEDFALEYDEVMLRLMCLAVDVLERLKLFKLDLD